MKIKSRVYYLLDKKGTLYRKYLYEKSKKGEKLMRQKEVVRVIDLEEKYAKYLDGKKPEFINKPLKNLFWQNASTQIRMALLFAHEKRVFKKENKVPNTEITNWNKDGFFKDRRDELVNITKLKSFRKIYKIIGSLYATKGKHAETLRFENIHLCMDIVKGKKIYSIHYDRHNPKPGLSHIKHLLFDDISS